MQTSPAKPSSQQGLRMGSALERNIPSPNMRRDPATPSRIVRATRTPPSQSQLTALPSIDETSRLSPPPRRQPSEDEVVEEVIATSSMHEQLRTAARQSSSVDQHYDEAFDSDDVLTSDDDDQQRTGPDRSGNLCAADAAPKEANSGDNSGPPMSVSPVQVPLSHPSPLPSGSSASQTAETRRSVSKRPPFNINVEKKERIGRGSFGDVFRAIDLDTGNEIAIKEIVVTQDWSKDLEKQIHTLEREVRVMQKLDHPNTVKYLGAKRTNGTLSIYMEYVGGGTIATLLRHHGPLNEVDTLRYTKQLLCGLDYLHDKRIAHRDLKGDNLFLTKDDVLKVGDFGTSKELQTMRVTDSVAGTPNFMAPEVIACSGHSYQADVWSVGCCVLQMLTGKPPFATLDNHMAVMFAVMKGQIDTQIPATVSLAVRDFLCRCFKTDAKERATTKQLLQHQWITGEVFVGPPPARRSSTEGGGRGTSVGGDPRAHEETDAQVERYSPPQPTPPPALEKPGRSPQRSPPPSRETHHRSHHQPVILPSRVATSREKEQPSLVSGSTSDSTSTPPSAEGKSPPPSAGAKPIVKSHFVSRFPRHGSAEAEPQSSPLLPNVVQSKKIKITKRR